MRTRLFGIFLTMVICMLATLSIPFAIKVASGEQQAIFVDRLQDTARFASAYQQANDEIDVQALRDDLTRYHDVYGIDAAILDRSGAVIESSGHIDLHGAGQRSAVHQALTGHQSDQPAIIWPGEHEALTIAVPVLRGDDVIAAAITVSPTSALRRILAVKLGMLTAADLAAIAVFILLSDRAAIWVLRPVYRLDVASRQISTGNLATRVNDRGGPVEIRRLAASFNRMALAVETAMDRQTRFVADASHQLRNPLAALTLRLEELRADVPERCMPAVADVLDESSRLRGIVDELLHLASVQEAAARSRAPTDVVDLLAGRIQAWRPLAQLRAITLHFQHPAQAPAQIDPTLVSSVLDAVLDNAIKFNADGGRVDIEVTVECARVRVDIADNGIGVDADEMERLGDRFWRSPSQQNVPGSGLGLSIARTITELCGGNLRFSAVEPSGLRVSLWLPVPPVPTVPAAGTPSFWPRHRRRRRIAVLAGRRGES